MKKLGPAAAMPLAALNLGALLHPHVASAHAQDLGADAARQRPNINPFNHDIALTTPLQFNNRILGEVEVVLTSDDRLLIDKGSLLEIIAPLLTDDAQSDIAAALAEIDSIEPEQLAAQGVELEYDPAQLVILILRIDPVKRAIQFLYETGERERRGREPEAFSAYLNSSIAVSQNSAQDGVAAPSVFLTGAARFGDVVFEADVQGREELSSEDYEVYRRYARLVYDQPEQYRRWFLGDLSPDTRGRQGFVEMGGIGVARQRQRFDSFRANVLGGGRQIVLQEPSTVRVLRNGLFQREFALDPGQYDLSNLPLDTGSNDIELEVVGQSGRSERLSYRAYLDTIDLEPGDYEYGAFLGVTSADAFEQPDYSKGDLAFTGYWRKAFRDRPAIGVGLQVSADVQNIMAQTQLIVGNGARLRLDGSASQANGEAGVAATLSYEHFVDRAGAIDSWAFVADYTSDKYAMLGNFDAVNPIAWAFSASYTRRFSHNLYGGVSASYRVSRSDAFDDSYSVNASANWRFTPGWSVQFGVEAIEYGRRNTRERPSVGGMIALVWQPRHNERAEARYSSLRNNAAVRFQRFAENRAGAIGYSASAVYDDGPGSVSGQVDYVGNRFDASLSHATFGSDFNNMTDQQITTLRVSSSLATAGGRVGVGRHINDSFALVYPHESLGKRRVIVGDNLQGGGYTARSGLLGAAVANNLSSYLNQPVRYDVKDLPPGYNIGASIETVHPEYRSGYAIEVGHAAFVSAMGVLVGSQDRPIALITGAIRPTDEPNAAPELFFTSTAGRFAIQNLEPGRRYRVDLASSPGVSFEFTVPDDNEGLLELGRVAVPINVP